MTNSSATWPTSTLARVAALVALLAAPSAAKSLPYNVFPEGERVFAPLFADPRHIQLGASYYRLGGKNMGDVALGHSWGMARWHVDDDRWTLQWNIEAMAYSRFQMGGGINEFETVDFFGNLPLVARRGPFSTQAMLFHESAHLGDDYIRRTGDEGQRFSVEGARVTLSLEATQWARVYGGMTHLLHAVPNAGRETFQWGLELTSRRLGWFEQYPMRLFLAQDFQSRENVEYNLNYRVMGGMIVGFREVPRSTRVYLSYFTGHSPFGQFYRLREHMLEFGIRFHL